MSENRTSAQPGNKKERLPDLDMEQVGGGIRTGAERADSIASPDRVRC